MHEAAPFLSHGLSIRPEPFLQFGDRDRWRRQTPPACPIRKMLDVAGDRRDEGHRLAEWKALLYRKRRLDAPREAHCRQATDCCKRIDNPRLFWPARGQDR